MLHFSALFKLTSNYINTSLSTHVVSIDRLTHGHPINYMFQLIEAITNLTQNEIPILISSVL